MDFSCIKFVKEDHISTITLNRPERHNAINERMVDEFQSALDDLAKDEDIRVMILAAAGDSFCVGGDLSGDNQSKQLFGLKNAETIRKALRHGQQTTYKIKNLPIPTIAMINGVAAGGGFDWALSCDIRIGSDNARFRVGFTNVGMVPSSGATWLLPRIMGVAKASELILTCKFVEASEAKEIGLLNRIVPTEDLEKETMSLARRMAQMPPVALRLSKLNINKGLHLELDAALEMLAATQAICFQTEDYAEALAAFREKRKPKFLGR